MVVLFWSICKHFIQFKSLFYFLSSAKPQVSKSNNSTLALLKPRPSSRPKLLASRRSFRSRSPNWKCHWMPPTKLTLTSKRPSRGSLCNSLKSRLTTMKSNANFRSPSINLASPKEEYSPSLLKLRKSGATMNL